MSSIQFATVVKVNRLPFFVPLCPSCERPRKLGALGQLQYQCPVCRGLCTDPAWGAQVSLKVLVDGVHLVSQFIKGQTLEPFILGSSAKDLHLTCSSSGADAPDASALQDLQEILERMLVGQVLLLSMKGSKQSKTGTKAVESICPLFYTPSLSDRLVSLHNGQQETKESRPRHLFPPLSFYHTGNPGTPSFDSDPYELLEEMDWQSWIPHSADYGRRKEHTGSVGPDAPLGSSIHPGTNEVLSITHTFDPFDDDEDASPELLNAVTALFKALGVED